MREALITFLQVTGRVHWRLCPGPAVSTLVCAKAVRSPSTCRGWRCAGTPLLAHMAPQPREADALIPCPEMEGAQESHGCPELEGGKWSCLQTRSVQHQMPSPHNRTIFRAAEPTPWTSLLFADSHLSRLSGCPGVSFIWVTQMPRSS